MRTRDTAAATLCAAVAVLMATAAAIGVFARGDGAALATTSIRGEPYAYVTSGVYAYNAARVVAEGVGWDWFTLLFAAPALLVVTPAVARGSLRGRLLALGLLAYGFYQYFMYAVTWAFGPLFPLFIVIYAASLIAAARILTTLPVHELPARLGPRFPRRGMAAVATIIAVALVGMWSARIVAGLRGDWDGAVLLGSTTMVIPAMDLGLVVPLCLWTAHAIRRGRPIGYLLAAILVVKGFAMGAAIVAMLLSAWADGGGLELPALAFFSAVTLAMGWLGGRMYAARPAAA